MGIEQNGVRATSIIGLATEAYVNSSVASIGGFAAKTAYVVGVNGNDATAVVGNILKPFATIGGAITAVTPLSGCLIEVLPGTYDLYDADCPYGLMVSNANYSYYFHANAIVNYFGSYGFFISNSTTFGSIYGLGQFNIYGNSFSGSVNGVSNYAINIALTSTRKYIYGIRLIADSSSSTANLFRAGTCTQTTCYLYVDGPVISRGGITILCDTASRFLMSGKTDVQNTSQSSKTISIVNANEATFDGIKIIPYAYGFGRTQPIGINIVSGINDVLQFKNLQISAASSAVGFKLINIEMTGDAVLSNLFFYKCLFFNRLSSAYTLAGNSIYANFNLSLKIIESYANADMAADPGKNITNLISAGFGFAYDANL